jgi:hypothetical protein
MQRVMLKANFMKILIRLLVTLTITIPMIKPVLASEGGTSSGGSDRGDFFSGAAWFLGADRAIKTCIDVDSNYGVSEQELKQMIPEAFAIWQKYVSARGIEHRFMDRSRDGQLIYELLPARQRFAFDISLRPSCDDSEDLKVFFGVADEAVKAVKATYKNPMGMAVRTELGDTNGFGRGLIWIDKMLDPKDNAEGQEASRLKIFATLLHEIGHVLGNGHVKGTIMESDLENHLDIARDFQELKIKSHSIDFTNQLESCIECFSVYKGSRLDGGITIDISAFELLFKRLPAGRVINLLQVDSNGNLQISLSDPKGLHSFKLPALSTHAVDGTAVKTFYKKITKVDKEIGWNMSYRAGGQKAFMFSEIKNADDTKTYPLAIYLNESAAIEIKLINNGKELTVFRAKPTGGLGDREKIK